MNRRSFIKTLAGLTAAGTALALRTKVGGDVTVARPRLLFTNLAGRTLDLQWKPVQEPCRDECKVDGRPMVYDQFPLLKTANLLHPIGGPLTARLPDGSTIIYDFTKWTITRS